MSQLIASGLNMAPVDISSAGDNTVIAAPNGRVIAVYRVKLSLASETTVQFKDGSTALSGPETSLSQILDYSDEPYYRTTAGNALVIALGGAIQCGGTIWYRLL